MISWEKKQFEDLFLIPLRNGINRPSASRGNGYKMINMREIFANDRVWDIDMERVLLNDKEKLTYLIIKNDLIFARQSIVAEGAGKCSFIKEASEITCFESHIIRVRLNSDLANSEFYYYLFQSDIGKAYLSTIRQQGVQAGIRGSDLARIKLPYPPIKIQIKIASILSAYDDLIENNLKRITLLEEIAQRTYEEWFVKFRVNGEKLPIDESKGLPAGWEIIKVGDLLDKVQSTIKIPSSEILSEGIIPVIDQSRDFVAGYTNEKLSITSLSKPIIVFGDHTRVLKFIDFPFARGADGTQLILSKNNRMPQHLFYHSLLNIDLSNYHYARHFKYLKDSEIILPIEKYSNKYEGLIKPIFEKIKVLRFQNVALKQSRDILLPRLMSGTINVES